ncbi:ATP-binding protein [Pseudomonas luteola]|uniref:AAA family ATPase n=1 Tax=Pseudomonas luteola TaxID=47886 RepID=UPI000F78D40A|nr:AAA family ATPase [Pseudomonas luteola]RRW45797.1 ATP-binding protein [Pseudomonas luteola]
MMGRRRTDSQSLSKIDFISIRIILRDLKKKPIIELTRDLDSPFFQATYRISDSSSERPFVYQISELDEASFLRESYFIRSKFIDKKIAGRSAKEHIGELVRISWLSVNRSAEGEGSTKTTTTSIDKKLEELSNRLVRYLSVLGKRANRLLENFQEEVFFSLLIQPKKVQDIFKIPSLETIKKEKDSLNQIFNQFGLDKKLYTQKIDNHFSLLEKAVSKMGDKETHMSNMEIASIFSLDRIEQTIEYWEKVVEERKTIFHPRDSFLQKINSMVKRKKFKINEQNELIVETQSGKNLPLPLLSSGEKQLLIILGEALLQEKKQYIYIADEPELSLHVSWQEALTKDIREINPLAQVIFATHSPDVVGTYSSKLINVEDCIK